MRNQPGPGSGPGGRRFKSFRPDHFSFLIIHTWRNQVSSRLQTSGEPKTHPLETKDGAPFVCFCFRDYYAGVLSPRPRCEKIQTELSDRATRRIVRELPALLKAGSSLHVCPMTRVGIDTHRQVFAGRVSASYKATAGPSQRRRRRTSFGSPFGSRDRSRLRQTSGGLQPFRCPSRGCARPIRAPLRATSPG